MPGQWSDVPAATASIGAAFSPPQSWLPSDLLSTRKESWQRIHRFPLIVGSVGQEVDAGNRRDRSVSQGAALLARGFLHPGKMGSYSPEQDWDCHPAPADPCLVVSRFWMCALILVTCERPRVVVWTVRAESPAASPGP